MTEVDLDRTRRRWPQRACALALLVTLGCSDAGVESTADVRRPAAGRSHTPRHAEIAWARPLVPPATEGIEPTGLMSLPPATESRGADRPRVATPALPILELLPPLEDGVAGEAAAPSTNSPPPAISGPRLLSPQPIDFAFTEWRDDAAPATVGAPTTDSTITPTPAIRPAPLVADEQSLALPPTINATSDDQGVSLSPEADELLADAKATVTGHPTGAMVSEQAQAKIRRGYKLAQRGAYFAARAEFVDVLRMIAEAKDQKRGAARRSVALANGLRALEEAADFAPRGAAIENRLDFDVIIASHRTPIAKGDASRLMPQQLADLYYRYAQLQLGASVAGEPAGSMALHALGKLYSQIGRAEPERIVQADRRAFALQQAALLARNDNHLAAHELGVLLAESGHFVDSEYILAQVAQREPHPVVFRNLARIQRKLGRADLASASEQQAHLLAERGVSSMSGVKWVDPQTLARMGDPLAPSAPLPTQVAAGPPIPQPRPQAPPAAQPPAPSEPVHNVTRLPGGYFR
jgi:hypothetical protein